jgi:hypothetical protein
MRRERAWLLAGGVAALVCALAAAAAVGMRLGPADAAGPPVAVVLLPHLAGSELVSVDLETGRVVGRVRLRSLATDIEADPDRGAVVAAQTGGVGAAADDALSITDVRSGAVRYVTLPQTDPSQVECVSGHAMVLHAVVETPGFVVSGVDLATGRAALRGHVPDGTGMWVAAAGGLWTAVATGGPVPYALVRVDPATLATAPGPAVGFSPCAVTMAGDRILVLGGAGVGGPAQACVALLDGTGASVTASATVAGLPHGAQLAATVGDLIVVGDWNGEAPETGSLAVLERTTLAPLRTLDVGGAPCALACFADRLLVVDRVSGTLSRVDPRTGTVDWRAALGATDLVCSKVVVLAGGGSAALPAPGDRSP